MITEVVKSIIGSHHELDAQHRTNTRHDRVRCVKRDDGMNAKRYIHKNGACVSSVDRGAGRLAIMCPVVAWQTMKQAWPDEPERCVIMSPATANRTSTDKLERDILDNYAKYYHQQDWSRISTLYGIDNRGSAVNCNLPRAYANPKLKTILAAQPGLAAKNMIKGRPISPRTKHPCRNVYNRSATGHHFVLTKIDTQRVTRMWTTK